MTATEMTATEPGADAQTARRKRVIVSMGGKGGVGKTNFMTGLAEWYQEQQIPVPLLDLDTENQARGRAPPLFVAPAPAVSAHPPQSLQAIRLSRETAPRI